LQACETRYSHIYETCWYADVRKDSVGANASRCDTWDAVDSVVAPSEPSCDYLMRASVVVPTYNGRRLLEVSLPRLMDEIDRQGDADVIVVDNGSADGTAEWVCLRFPHIRIEKMSRNTGFGAACNRGASAAIAPIVVFVNNDALVKPGWLEPLATELESSADVVICGGLTLFDDQPDVVNSAGVRLSLSGAGSDIGFGACIHAVDLTARDVGGVSGVSMAVQRDWFLRVGGFDERFFMYFEDVDLCLRAWMGGKRVRFAPESVVRHRFGGSAGSRYSTTRNFYGSRNRLLMVWKCFDLRSVPLAVGLSFAQDVTVVLWLYLTGRRDLAKQALIGKIRGTLAAVREAPSVLAKRRQAGADRVRGVRSLRRLRVIDSPSTSAREFLRMRRLEAGRFQKEPRHTEELLQGR
jgi:N-acetylglucosaminyl-diphospho-decaprenol L-rhamnosyltransferase